jgi:hypothetical protein
MSVYYMNEAAFELPDDPGAALADQTVTELYFPGGSTGGQSPFSLTVHRKPLARGESLTESVAADVREADRSLPSHALLFQRAIEVAGVPAIELAARWRGEESMLYTRQAHLAHAGVVLVLAGNARLQDRDDCDAMMDRVLATFRPRG